jgi:hypothetical protein
MAELVLWLACSLGQQPVAHQVPYPPGRGGGIEYRLWWTATAPVFRMPRKLAQLNTTSTAELHARMLVRADPAPVQPMRCLTVDSPNSMFLVTPWCIPTHNTMFGAPSEWTPVSKTCPVTIRIRQFNQTALPAIVAGSGQAGARHRRGLRADPPGPATWDRGARGTSRGPRRWPRRTP